MQITRFKTQYLPTTILVVVGVFVWVFTHSDVIAYHYATYAESAHGNNNPAPGYGVNRSTATCENWPGGECVTGSCAHCHDTFDPDICGNNVYGLMLFASNGNPDSQTDNFCFQCHKGTGSVQDGGITNHTYSTNFGGGTATFTTIYDAFNPTTGDTPSSHQLSDIQNYVTGKLDYTSDTNPCFACHSQHTAQKNYPVTATGMGGVKTAVRRSTHYDGNLKANLWGDEDLATSGYYERMKDLADYHQVTYQAPYYKNVPHDPDKYEPANDDTVDGSNLPNFATFCWDCHRYDNIPSTEHGTIDPINWSTSTDFPGLRNVHGLQPSIPYDELHDGGSLKAPYTDDSIDDTINYCLSCTDCHEPHGSPNEWLLRTSVNGKDNISITVSGQWYEFCTACHEVSVEIYDDEHVTWSYCSGCHGHHKNPNKF